LPAASLSARMTLGMANCSLHARDRANIPTSPYGLGGLKRTEHATLANGSEHKLPIGRSPSPAEQEQMEAARAAGVEAARKAVAKKAKPTGPLGKQMGGKSKSDKLGCRYCRSDDLPRVSSRGGIADAASVLINAMVWRHERGRRSSRTSLAMRLEMRDRARKGSALYAGG
jgi:hypothetical protein